MKISKTDIVAGIGAAFVVGGIWMIYAPLAAIVLGSLLVFASVKLS